VFCLDLFQILLVLIFFLFENLVSPLQNGDFVFYVFEFFFHLFIFSSFISKVRGVLFEVTFVSHAIVSSFFLDFFFPFLDFFFQLGLFFFSPLEVFNSFFFLFGY